MPLTKKQKLVQRERNILFQARKTVAEQGLIGLKMPILAQQAQVSIGTLYRHFESREDLIAAIAEYALATRCKKLEQTLLTFDTPLQRLIAMPLLDFLFNVAHSEAFHTETSCTNSQLWQFASDAMYQRYLLQADRVSLLANRIVEPFCDAKTDGQQGSVNDVSTGLWSLITGMSYIWHSSEQQSAHTVALDFFRPHLKRFFQGYLPQLTITPQDISQVEDYLLNHSELWQWKMQGDINEDI